MKSSRRTFLIQTAGIAGAVVGMQGAFAAPAQVSEADPQAVSLGYRSDATKVDAAKFPSYSAGHVCGGCMLYQGKSTDASGPCQIFSGQNVSSKGWCSAWTKKS